MREFLPLFNDDDDVQPVAGPSSTFRRKPEGKKEWTRADILDHAPNQPSYQKSTLRSSPSSSRPSQPNRLPEVSASPSKLLIGRGTKLSGPGDARKALSRQGNSQEDAITISDSSDEAPSQSRSKVSKADSTTSKLVMRDKYSKDSPGRVYNPPMTPPAKANRPRQKMSPQTPRRAYVLQQAILDRNLAISPPQLIQYPVLKKRRVDTYETDSSFAPALPASKVSRRQGSDRASKPAPGSMAIPLMDAPDEQWIKSPKQTQSASTRSRLPAIPSQRPPAPPPRRMQREVPSTSNTSSTSSRTRPPIPPSRSRSRQSQASQAPERIISVHSDTSSSSIRSIPRPMSTPHRKRPLNSAFSSNSPLTPLSSAPETINKSLAKFRSREFGTPTGTPTRLVQQNGSVSSHKSAFDRQASLTPTGSAKSAGRRMKDVSDHVAEDEEDEDVTLREETEEDVKTATEPESEQASEKDEFDFMKDFDDYEFAPSSPDTPMKKLSQASPLPSSARHRRLSNTNSLLLPSNKRFVTPPRDSLISRRTLSPLTHKTPLGQSRFAETMTTHRPTLSSKALESPSQVLRKSLDKARAEKAEMERKKQIALEERLKKEAEEKAREFQEAREAREAEWKRTLALNVSLEDPEEEFDLKDVLEKAPSRPLITLEKPVREIRRSSRQLSDSTKPLPLPLPDTKIKSKEDIARDREMRKLTKEVERRQKRELELQAFDEATIENNPYPTPESRDRSHDSTMEENVSVNLGKLKDALKNQEDGMEVDVDDLKGLQAGNGENRGEPEWDGIYLGEEFVYQDLKLQEVSVPDSLRDGMFGRILVRAVRNGSSTMLTALLRMNDGQNFRDMNALQTQEMMELLISICVMTADPHHVENLVQFISIISDPPFSSFEAFSMKINEILSSIGIKPSYFLESSQEIDSQPGMSGKGLRRCVGVELVVSLIYHMAENAWLSGLEVASTIPLLMFLHAEPTTKTSMKDEICRIFSKISPVCLSETTALELAKTICQSCERHSIPLRTKREIISFIGRRTAQCRELTRWVSLGFIDLLALEEISQDKIHLLPSIEMMTDCIYIMMDDMRNPEVRNIHRLDDQVEFFIEMLNEMELLFDGLPPVDDWNDPKLEPVREFRGLIRNLGGRCSRYQEFKASSTRAKIVIMAEMIYLRTKHWIKVQDTEKLRKKKEERESKGLLKDGENGQMRLSFGAKRPKDEKTDVKVKEEVQDSLSEEEEQEEV